MRTKKRCVIFLSIIFSLILASVIQASADDINHVINFSKMDFIFEKIGDYDTIEMKECSFTREPGKPQLPLKVIHFAIPSDKRVRSIEIMSSSPMEIAGEFNIYPAQESRIISLDPEEFTPPDSSVYSSDVSYPLNRVELKECGKIGGGKIATIHIYPLEYKPVLKKLILHTRLQIRIILETDAVWSSPAVKNETIKEFFWNIVANHETAEEYAVSGTYGAPIDYLIITSDSLMAAGSAFQSLSNLKISKGLSVTIESVQNIDAAYPGSDLQEKIRNYIIDKYTNNGVKWVLLGGDTNIVPARAVFNPTGLHCHNSGAVGGALVCDNVLLCDMYYSNLDGNWNADGDGIYGELADDVDLYPDVFVGRAPVEDESEAQAFVDKIITYEAQVSTYDHNLLFLGCNDFGDAGGKSKDFIDEHYIPQDFYILKLYERNITKYSGMTIAAINNGFHLINHIDHADIGELHTGDNFFDPNYITISDIDGLTNGTKPSIFWSVGCWAAAIDYDCIAEHWITNPNGGGVAFVGNSRYGWSPESDQMLDPEFYRSLFIQGYKHIGQTVADAKLTFAGLVTSNPYMRYAMFEQNLLGDPQLEIAISRAPMDLALVLDFSGSMSGFGSCEDTPLLRKYEVLQQGVDSLLHAWEPFAVPEDRIGVMYFGSDIDPLTGPTMVNLLANINTVTSDVYAHSPAGCTALGAGVLKAADAIDQTRLKKHMIILSNGEQNVNPEIVSVGDVDFDGIEEHHVVTSGYSCGGVDSSVLQRPGVFLDSFNIHMHTISIGSPSGPPADLLAAVAEETGGLNDHTCKPPEELEKIFINQLVEALRQDTVELVGYETGTISSSNTCCYPHYTFPINGSVKRAVFMLSWTAEAGETGNLSLRLFTPKGFEVPVASYEKKGKSFQRIVLDFPMFLPSHPYKPIDFVGDWEVVIKPVLKRNTPVIYRTFALVDDDALDFDISVDKTTVSTGEPIPLHVYVTEGEKPLKPSHINVRVQKPRTSVANILSTTSIDKVYTNQIAYAYGIGEVQSSPLTLAYEAAYLIPEYAALLAPIGDTVTLYDDATHGDAVSGDGIYSGLYNDTKIPGKYEFEFYVDGNSTFHGPYHREKRCTATAIVRTLTMPNLDLGLLGTSVQGGNFRVVITPQDSNGNFLGPGYADRVNISIPNAVPVAAIVDNNNGSYTQTFSVSKYSNITSGDVMIFDNHLAVTGLDKKVHNEVQKRQGPVSLSWCCYQWNPCNEYNCSLYQNTYYGWPNQDFSYYSGYGYLTASNLNVWAIPPYSISYYGDLAGY